MARRLLIGVTSSASVSNKQMMERQKKSPFRGFFCLCGECLQYLVRHPGGSGAWDNNFSNCLPLVSVVGKNVYFPFTFVGLFIIVPLLK